jgi:hypothetical protein
MPSDPDLESKFLELFNQQAIFLGKVSHLIQQLGENQEQILRFLNRVEDRENGALLKRNIRLLHALMGGLKRFVVLTIDNKDSQEEIGI